MAATRADIEERYQYLIGNTDSATADTVGVSHINATVRDICNTYPFSWNRNIGTIALSSGTAAMPSDYNPIWQIEDVRIVGTGDDNDSQFTPVTLTDRDVGSDYFYWITADGDGTYTFNTKTQSGTVTLGYFFNPTAMTLTSSAVIVPDYEMVAYGAAAKNWIGDERNTQLKDDYYKEYRTRLQNLYTNDLNFGPTIGQRSVIRDNPVLTGGISDEIKIQV